MPEHWKEIFIYLEVELDGNIMSKEIKTVEGKTKIQKFLVQIIRFSSFLSSIERCNH